MLDRLAEARHEALFEERLRWPRSPAGFRAEDALGSPDLEGFVPPEECAKRMEVSEGEVLALARSGYLLARWHRRASSARLGRAVPCSPQYDEHLEDNFGELLPHLFFGDVARYAERLNESGEGEALQALLNFLDTAWADDPKVDELIHVSFVENLEPHGARNREIGKMLGPKLASAWSEYL